MGKPSVAMPPLVLSLLAAVTAGSAQASDGLSPHAVLFAPKTGEWIHTSGLSYYKTHYQVRSLLINSDANSRYGLVSHAIDYGLTDRTTLSVQQVYAKQFQSNPYNLAQGRVGWRSPKFQVTYLDRSDDGWSLKPSAGVQFNPATSSGMNYFFGALDVVYGQVVPHQSWALAVGAIHTEHKDIDGRSDGLRLEMNLGQAAHHWKLKVTRARLSSLSSSLGSYDASWYQTKEVEWAYRLRGSTWVSLGYLHETNDSRFLQTLGPLEYKNKRRHQQVTASIKWRWGH